MTTEEIENRFKEACDAIGAELAKVAHPLIAEVARLQAENAEHLRVLGTMRGLAKEIDAVTDELEEVKASRDAARAAAVDLQSVLRRMVGKKAEGWENGEGESMDAEINHALEKFDKLNAKV